MSEQNQEYYDGVLPSPIAPDKIKRTKGYGAAVGQFILRAAMNGDNSYYAVRNAQFDENMMYANGRQPIKTYLDLMEIDPQQMFSRFKYHPRPIAPKFRDILINTIMEKDEWIECNALSLDIQKRKADKISDASFRMDNKNFINNVQQQTGIKFEDDNAITPGSPEELKLWAKMNNKEREELLMQEANRFVLINNAWETAKKRVIVGDIVDNGMCWTRTYLDNKNRIKIDRVGPKQMIYGPTGTHNFEKTPYIGHLERMSVVDARCKWPKYPEEKLYDLAVASRTINPNNTMIVDFQHSFYDSPIRPYDSFLIDVFYYEYRVTKFKEYSKKSDKNDNTVVDYVDNTGKDTDKKAPIPTIFCGAMPVAGDEVFEWGEMSNMLRNNNDYEDVSSSYSGFIINNLDTMLPLSPMSYCRSSIINMDLAILKLQQHLINAAPDGVKIDIDMVTAVDFGAGIGKLGPMKLRQYRKQTGDIVFSSKGGLSGLGASAMPIEDAIHSMGDKISQFISAYNFEYDNLRNYIGYNPQTDGSGTPDRLSPSVQQNQMEITNTATAHLYDGYINVFGSTGKKTTILMWQTLKYGNENSLYLKLLGQNNIDFIRYRTDIVASNYLTDVTVDMSQQERQFLENLILQSLNAQTIEPEDALFLKKTTDVDLAIAYLGFIKDQRAAKKQAMQDQSAQQLQAQGAQQQMAIQNKKSADQLAHEQLQEAVEESKLVTDAMVLLMENPATVFPPYVQALVNKKMAQLGLPPQPISQQSQGAALPPQLPQGQSQETNHTIQLSDGSTGRVPHSRLPDLLKKHPNAMIIN